MIFMSQEFLWTLFPRISADKVRWMRLYCTSAFGLGVGLTVWSGRQDYSSKFSKPGFFYKQHLKRLHRQGKITDEKYSRLLSGADAASLALCASSKFLLFPHACVH
ncbi:hypothetical protein Efla_003531 [Eimeria flavescens]